MTTRQTVLTLVLIFIAIPGIACKKSSGGNTNSNSSNETIAADTTVTTPPFSTKEPERYQATMVTSGSLGGQTSSVPGLTALTNQQMKIARDGANRRVETEMLPGIKIVYLQLGASRYVLYPAKKIYAEIKMDGTETTASGIPGVPSDFVPNKMVNGAPEGAKYEKLGTEEINGRMTTKYRVTSGGPEGSKETSETIVWADESLGMPIKFESASKDGAKFSTEMRDIKQEVDSALFVLPKDFQKVEHSDLISRAVPSISDLLGGEKENKNSKKR